MVYCFEPEGEVPNFWELKDRELVKSCLLIAEGRAQGATGPMRAEAMRLLLLWNDTLTKPGRTSGAREQIGEERETRAALALGLRKRTIQLLVRLLVTESAATPAR